MANSKTSTVENWAKPVAKMKSPVCMAEAFKPKPYALHMQSSLYILAKIRAESLLLGRFYSCYLCDATGQILGLGFNLVGLSGPENRLKTLFGSRERVRCH